MTETHKRKTGDVKSTEIVLEAEDELTIVAPNRKRDIEPLTEQEARDLTIEIRRTVTRLWILVVEAYDRKAHVALGYPTWNDYVQTELCMSPSRSYQLLDTGHVMKELAVAGADISMMDPPPARVVGRVKDRLADVRRVAKKALKGDGDIDSALRALAREAKPPTAPAEGAAPPTGALAPAADTGSTEGDDGGAAGGTQTETVECPACRGSGQVDRSVASRLSDFIKKSLKS